MTKKYREASGAQRRGAASLRLFLRGASGHWRDHARARGSSSLCLRTPAQFNQKYLWTRHDHGGGGPWSAVLQFYMGQGGGTSKRLILAGSIVLFYSSSRDVRVCASVRVYARVSQNHRTIEPVIQNGRKQPFLPGSAVLARFYGSRADIKSGGYAGADRTLLVVLDPQLFAEGARRNFRGWRAAAGPIGALGELLDQAGGNGGFPWVLGGARGHVGMAMSERGGKPSCSQPLANAQQKPARLTDGAGEPGGLAAPRAGGTPPNAAAVAPTMSALTAFEVWIEIVFHRRCEATSSTNNRQKGSGERPRPVASRASRSRTPQADARRWVRDRGVTSSASGQRREAQRLWAGANHVNG